MVNIPKDKIGSYPEALVLNLGLWGRVFKGPIERFAAGKRERLTDLISAALMVYPLTKHFLYHRYQQSI
jgi:hypothetical protein